MPCDLFSKQLEQYARGELAPAMEHALESHLAECPSCADRLDAEHSFLDALRAQSVPAPSDDFESRVLAVATGKQGRKTGAVWQHPVMGGAVAAVLALGIYIGLQEQSPEIAQPALVVESEVTDTVPEVFAPEEQTVQLAFHSNNALDDVTLTLELPPNVELASFPGRHRLSWQVSLQQGDNVLSLPLKVLFPGDGQLVAHLDDGTRQKTFRAPIQAKSEPAS
ncbi:anti-sigma factor family protein [Marinobacter mobilis]|uniref:Putative zinc-finger n=1 Tax=Marinobacter mobilis TaxID=488533 RepID=A0A1H2Y0B4_9GAMM|nr:zf-HC2 domain-containing protein [Marinobacter mobilis]SDW98238.1 Putative zinc-finger [Marinobacter mobilis]